jgi:hypothetical protein
MYSIKPPHTRRPKISARSISASRKLTAPMLACKAGMVLLAEAEHVPTVCGMAATFGVSIPFVAFAMRLPPEVRAAIAAGDQSIPFAVLMKIAKAGPPEESEAPIELSEPASLIAAAS